MEVPRGAQHWGLKFHTDCEVMSRTANAKDPNTAQRPRASSYPCLQQHFPPKKLSLLQTQSLCHVSPGMLQWEVLGCWVSPRGLWKCKQHIPPEECSASWISISYLLPCNSHGLTCRDAGLLDSPHAVSVQSQTDREMQHSPRLDSKAVFQRCLQHSPEFVINSELCPTLLCPRQAVSKLLGSCWLEASAARSESAGTEAQSTRAMALSPGSLHAKATSASSPAQRRRSPVKWHRAITNIAGSISWWISWMTRIHSAACTLCGKEPYGQ